MDPLIIFCQFVKLSRFRLEPISGFLRHYHAIILRLGMTFEGSKRVKVRDRDDLEWSWEGLRRGLDGLTKEEAIRVEG